MNTETTLDILTHQTITELHDQLLHNNSWKSTYDNDNLLSLIEKNHWYNSSLWTEEDQARRLNVSDKQIANNKRKIDLYNQQRNDMIEMIDEKILLQLKDVSMSENATLHCETAGSMIDRLSILSLKIFNMNKESIRQSATKAHRSSCKIKKDILQTQRIDLGKCLQHLIDESFDGKMYYKIYRQYKMYNDPDMNPYLYNIKKST